MALERLRHDGKEGIKSYQEVLANLKQETADLVYQKAGEEFNFITGKLDKVYATANQLYKPFGYSHPKKILELLSRHNIKTYSVKDFPTLGVSFVRQVFYLSPSDYKTRLIDYKGFYVLVHNSKTRNARKVQKWFEEFGDLGRVTAYTYEKEGTDPVTFALQSSQNPLLRGIAESIKNQQAMLLTLVQHDEAIQKLQGQTNLLGTKVATLEQRVEDLKEDIPLNSKDRGLIYNEIRSIINETIITFGLEQEQRAKSSVAATIWFYYNGLNGVARYDDLKEGQKEEAIANIQKLKDKIKANPPASIFATCFWWGKVAYRNR